MCKALFVAFLLSASLLVSNSYGESSGEEVCMYTNEKGTIEQVQGRKNVPVEFRSEMKCFAAKKNTYLAAPEDITLKGSKREESMPSSLGRIELRWPRVVETLFGRTPTRAMSDAARAASRFIKKPGWPSEIRRLDLDYNVVFMDASLSSAEIPANLVSNCHPGWMTPPANIYIVAQRAAAGCGGASVRKSEADAKLAEVLIHEIGHSVEASLLGSHFGGERFRAEGFATWFEANASDESAVIRSGKVRGEHFAIARAYLRGKDHMPEFDGSAGGYASRALLFHAITETKGVRGLMRVYQTMREDGLTFYPAVEKSLGWSQEKLEERALKLIR
ncbi:MAG: hypothetical protein KDD55_05050 [Bdellovibrionales bacterium]|nr:hypothetical protein [Bdellovibrionales bacterium]